MSSQPTTAPVHRDLASREPADAGRARVVAAALTAGAALVVTVLIWQPWPGRNNFAYADLAPVRDAAWTGALVDGVGLAALGIALGIAVCLLTPGRGRVIATLAAVLTCLGGAVQAAGVISLGTLAWYGTAPGVVPAPVGTALFADLERDLGHLLPLQAGFLMFTLGVLLALVALWRAGAVPRWATVAIAVLTVGQFAGVEGRALDLVQGLQVASLVLVAAFLWTSSTTRRD